MSLKDHPVAVLSDFRGNRVLEVEADGRPILLIRIDGTVRAVGALCPHAGARLVEGVFTDDRVICPWHKAAFCIRTGEVLEPPALDPLSRYEVKLAGDQILLSDEGREKPKSMARDKDRRRSVGAPVAGHAYLN